MDIIKQIRHAEDVIDNLQAQLDYLNDHGEFDSSLANGLFNAIHNAEQYLNFLHDHPAMRPSLDPNSY